MPIKGVIVKKGDHEEDVLIEKEVEKQREEKYKQLEFEFEDYNISDDQVAPI